MLKAVLLCPRWLILSVLLFKLDALAVHGNVYAPAEALSYVRGHRGGGLGLAVRREDAPGRRLLQRREPAKAFGPVRVSREPADALDVATDGHVLLHNPNVARAFENLPARSARRLKADE